MAKRKPRKQARRRATKPRKRAVRKKASKAVKLGQRYVWALGLMVSLPLLLMAVFVHVLGWKLHYWGVEAWPPFVFGALVAGFLATEAIIDLLTAKSPEKALK